MAAVFQKILAFFMSILAFFGIGKPEENTEVIVSGSKTVSCEKSGSTLDFNMTGNPSTGFDWTYTVEGSSVVFTEKKTEIKNSSSASKVTCGAPCTYHFYFEIKEAGTTEIVFTYARAWEDSLGSRTIVTVDVAEDLSVTVTASDLTVG